MSEETIIETPTPAETPAEVTNAPDTPEATSEFSSLINSDGSFKEEFYSTLPDGLGEHNVIKKYKTIQDLAKGTVNQSRFVGDKASEFWASEDPSDIEMRREILGIPDDAGKYEMNVEELTSELPDDVKGKVSAYIEKSKERALKAGMSQSQYQQLLGDEISDVIAEYKESTLNASQALEDARNELKGEWKGDQYSENVEKVANTLEVLGLGHWVENSAISNNPAIIKDIFNIIVPMAANDSIIEANQKENMSTIGERLDDLNDKMLHFEGDTNSPEYKDLTRKFSDLAKRVK